MRLVGKVCLCAALAAAPIVAPAETIIGAGVSSLIRGTATGDIVSDTATLQGTRFWYINMYNPSGNPNDSNAGDAITLHNPKISITSTLPDITGKFYSGEGNNIQYVEDTRSASQTVTAPTLGPFNDPTDNLQMGWQSTNVTDTFTPGFIASRSVSPSVIPANSTVLQTLTIQVKFVDSRYQNGGTGLWVNTGGNCQSATPQAFWCNAGGVGWQMNNYTVGQQYTFTAVLSVTNSTSVPMVSKPSMSITANYNSGAGWTTANTVDVNDPVLGKVTFSVDETVTWGPGFSPNYIVDFPAVWEQPTDTTPPAITYTNNLGTYTVDQPVDITCTATDSESGVASTTCKNIVGPAYTLPLGANSYSASATDNAGNIGYGSTSFVVKATSGSVCNLVKLWVTQPGVANSLCVKLDAASSAATRGNLSAKAGAIGAFDNEVSAQSGKFIAAEKAALLMVFAAAL